MAAEVVLTGLAREMVSNHMVHEFSLNDTLDNIVYYLTFRFLWSNVIGYATFNMMCANKYFVSFLYKAPSASRLIFKRCRAVSTAGCWSVHTVPSVGGWS